MNAVPTKDEFRSVFYQFDEGLILLYHLYVYSKHLQTFLDIFFSHCPDETGRIGFSDLKKIFDSYGMYFDSDENDLKALVSTN